MKTRAMPSISKKQQNFFRLVKLVKDGKIKKKDVDDKVVKAAKSMSREDISDFSDHIRRKRRKTNESNEYIMEIFSEYTEYDLLDEFMSDKRDGIETVQFDLIPKAQYTNLLRRYMSAPYPEAARIPDNIVNEWFKQTVRNFLKIYYITDFAGHSPHFPTDVCEDFFSDENVDWGDYSEASEYLENIGFYDWCCLPDGSYAWSDYGMEPILKIIDEYSEDMSGAEKLLLINRILDVQHHRGDLSSAFIEGGARTCSEISGMTEGRHMMTFGEYIESKGLW